MGTLNNHSELLDQLLMAYDQSKSNSNKESFNNLYKKISEKIEHSDSLITTFLRFKEEYGLSSKGETVPDDEYEKIKKVANFVVEIHSGSASRLQRNFGFNFAEAARVLSVLESIGIIDEEKNVLVNDEQSLHNILEVYKNGGPKKEFNDRLHLWDSICPTDAPSKIFPAEKLFTLLSHDDETSEELLKTLLRNINLSEQLRKSDDNNAKKSEMISDLKKNLSEEKSKEVKYQQEIAEVRENIKSKKDEVISVNFSFKIKKLLGWQRVTCSMNMPESEYKALLKGSDRNRKNFVINHANDLDLGFVGRMNVEGIDGVTIERN